jgi:hypothetical protein
MTNHESSIEDVDLENGRVANRPQLSPLQSAFDDWLRLLGGPDDPPFRVEATFELEWGRLFRLLGVVVFLSGVALGIPTIATEGLRKGFESMVVESKPALFLLMGGAALSAMYSFVFGSSFFIRKLQCVPMTLRQSFFTMLLMGLPWLPPTALMKGLTHTDISSKRIVTFLIIAWFYIAIIGFLYNFYRGVSIIHPRCPRWRILLSIMLPLAVLVALFLLVI